MSTALTRLESDHKTRLLQTKAKTIESIFEHAAAVLAFYEDCKKQREWGENTFANRIGEWLNYSRQTGGEWLMVARAQSKFAVVNGEIPPSLHSLALLAPLPQEDIEECLSLKGPDTTQQDIIAFKRALKAPPPKPSPKLTAEDVAAHQARITQNKAKQEALFDGLAKSVEALASVAQSNAPQAILADVSPIVFLANTFYAMLQQGGAPAVKLAKQMFSSAYHPDSGKVKHDAELMGSINKALSFLE